jgi:hypothetical protein
MIIQVLIYKSLYWILNHLPITGSSNDDGSENEVDDSDDFDISEFMNYYESNEPNLSNYFQQYLLTDFFDYILTS